MKSAYIFVILIATALAASCNGKGDPGKKDADADIWTRSKPLVARVEVSDEGRLIETYEYTYDDKGRMLTLVKTDNMSKAVMLDLQYSYPAENQMKITGKFYPISTNRFMDVSYSPKEGVLTYSGSWSGAWTYTTTINADGVATATQCKEKFASTEGYYSSDMVYSEAYTVAGGTIAESLAGTDIKAKGSNATSTANSSALRTVYVASDKADRQNFAAYLMPDTFPVWIASGLPGNKNLIKGITGFTGTVQTAESTAIEYTLNADGDIDTATRTDSNAGAPILVRTYKFIYQ